MVTQRNNDALNNKLKGNQLSKLVIHLSIIELQPHCKTISLRLQIQVEEQTG